MLLGITSALAEATACGSKAQQTHAHQSQGGWLRNAVARDLAIASTAVFGIGEKERTGAVQQRWVKVELGCTLRNVQFGIDSAIFDIAISDVQKVKSAAQPQQARLSVRHFGFTAGRVVVVRNCAIDIHLEPAVGDVKRLVCLQLDAAKGVRQFPAGCSKGGGAVHSIDLAYTLQPIVTKAAAIGEISANGSEWQGAGETACSNGAPYSGGAGIPLGEIELGFVVFASGLAVIGIPGDATHGDGGCIRCAHEASDCKTCDKCLDFFHDVPF